MSDPDRGFLLLDDKEVTARQLDIVDRAHHKPMLQWGALQGVGLPFFDFFQRVPRSRHYAGSASRCQLEGRWSELRGRRPVVPWKGARDG